MPNEFQESLKSDLQQQLQEVEQRRHDLKPGHHKVQKSSHKTKSFQDKIRNTQKEVPQHKRRCGRSERKLIAVRSDFGRSDEVDKYRMVDAEIAAELQGCRQEKKEEAAMLRKLWIVAWRRWWNSSSVWEQIRRGLSSMLCARCS